MALSWKTIKSVFDASLDVYRSQKSFVAVGYYFGRLLLRRGPAAIRRRLETVRSLARLAQEVPRQSGQISVAALIHGAIGDSVMAARFLRDLKACCPEVVFDIYTANVAQARWIFGEVGGVNNCLQDSAFDRVSKGHYDASFIFEDTVRVANVKPALRDKHVGMFSSVLESIDRFYENHKEHDGAPYNPNGVLAQELLYRYGTNRAKAAHLIAGIDYGGDRYCLAVEDGAVAKFSLSGKRYITVHNGFDLSQVTHTGSVTKVYPKFGEVIAEVRKAKPEFAFVQIGASTSIAVEGIDFNLIGKTSLREAASLVKQASCHLDNEGGLVTIASCYGVPCCVVFGPSSPDYFSYQGNIAVRPVECGGCWWITKDWLSRCPRGMPKPVCMYAQPPSAVARATLQLLEFTER